MAKIVAECFEDKLLPGQWRVEWIGDGGECFVTIFSGPFAQNRAEDYQKYAQERIDDQEA